MKRGLLLCFCFLAGCGETGPPTRGTPVAFDQVCDKSNDGKRVMIEGYLGFPEDFTFRGDGDTVMLRIRPALETGTPVGVSAKIANGPNAMDLPPKSYRNSDLKLRTSDSQTIGYGTKIKVSGTMYYPSSIAKVDFKCGLTNSLFESAGK
jgi:hypothetical protein